MTLPYADPTNTGQWAADLLTTIGAPLSASNEGYVEAWEHVESPSGYGYNPFGEETPGVGSIHAPGNSASVQAYKSWLSGLTTTAYNLESVPSDSQLLADLRQGNASLAELAGAQSEGGWKGGLEPGISALGTSTPFTYGGLYGLTPGAKGVATSPGDKLIPGIGPEGLPAPAPGKKATETLAGYHAGLKSASDYNPIPGLSASIFGPLTSWIEKGAPTVAFVGFGMVLVLIGLVVTFKDTTAGGAAIGATKDAIAA